MRGKSDTVNSSAKGCTGPGVVRSLSVRDKTVSVQGINSDTTPQKQS